MRPHLRLLAAAGAAAVALLPVVAASPAEAALLPTDEHVSTSITSGLPGGALEAGVAASLNIFVAEKSGGDPGGLQGRADITITTPTGSQHHARQVHAANAAWTYSFDTSQAGRVTWEVDFVPASGYENETPESESGSATIQARPTLSTTSNVVAAGGTVTAVVSDADGMAGAEGTVTAATGGLNLGSCSPTVGSDQTTATCTMDVAVTTAPGIYSVPFGYSSSARYQAFSTTVAIQVTAASSGGSSASSGSGSGSSGRSGGSSSGGSSSGGSGGGGTVQGGTGTVALPGTSVSATPGGSASASALPAGVLPSPSSTVLFAKQASAPGPVSPVVAVIGVVVLVAVVVLVLLIVLVVRAARRA